ncbi:MAG: HAMP domain-containing histidine kinase [bacterium]|nr:HAMP domain-containing histidine kinase [bacterium]
MIFSLNTLSFMEFVLYVVVFWFTGLLMWYIWQHLQKTNLIGTKILNPELAPVMHINAMASSSFVVTDMNAFSKLEKTAEFGELSKGLFHDLMNHVGTLSLQLEKAESIPIGHETYNEIQKIVGTSRRMQTYMNSMRRCISTDSNTTAGEVADVAREIGIVCDVLAYKARMNNVELNVEMSEPISLPIHPIRLHQLVLNLVTNAIDACAEKNRSTHQTQHVTISATKTDTAIILIVRDTGCGMKSENISRVGKVPFTSKVNGTGVGLMTVRTIVEKELGGTIEVKNNEGGGASFVIGIPVK